MKTARRRGVDRLFWASLVGNPTVSWVLQHEGLIAREP